VDRKLKVLIEIDSGLKRCGISPDDVGDFVGQIRHHRYLEVVGVFTHAGHSYAARSRAELEEIARQEVASVNQAAAAARRAGVNVTVTSVGSTPTILANVDMLEEATEIRPGNYIFKDRMQVSLGGASLDECALSVLCTVVSTASGNAVIDAGSKTFGQDRGAHGNLGVEGFGIGLDGSTRVDRLSEEHGIISDGAAWLEPGARLRLIPNHACIVADLAQVLHAVDGEQVVDSFAVDVRGGGS
jgi:D-serine deaminase-like pyridoxal phosphate-dependent protein